MTPGTYTYQIDFGNKLFSVSDDYREFMNESISDSIHLVVQLFAIVLMLIGTYLTAKQTAENNSDRS